MQTKSYKMRGLQPILRPELATKIGVRLPVGANLKSGTVLGLVTTASPANAVRTLTISGSPTGGNFAVTYTGGGRVYTTDNLAHNVSLSLFQQALENIFGRGNVVVTGTAGSTYTVTFSNMLGNVRIGGTFGFVNGLTGGSSPNGSWANTVSGTAGVGQYDRYDDAATDGTQTARAILCFDYASDPQGGNITELGIAGQPESPSAFVSGYFRCGDLIGLDANGANDLGRLISGTSATNSESVLAIF